MGGRLIPRSETVVLDVNGNGVVTFAIDNGNTWWLVDSVHVQTTQTQTQTPIPQAVTARNGVPYGGTWTGNLDTAAGDCLLSPDDNLTVTWSGGVPGTTATAIIGGTFGGYGEALPEA